MPDLWLISTNRHGRLADGETVRLGRALVADSETRRVWFPEAETATVVVRDVVSNEISTKAVRVVTEILGPHTAIERPSESST